MPGDKNSGGRGGGADVLDWFGNRNTGQTDHCVSHKAADNSVYGGRTAANVRIKSDQWMNNEVIQLRFSANGSWADDVTVVIAEALLKEQ